MRLAGLVACSGDEASDSKVKPLELKALIFTIQTIGVQILSWHSRLRLFSLNTAPSIASAALTLQFHEALLQSLGSVSNIRR